MALALCGGLGATTVVPATASAHGPIAPVASSYLARVARAPRGIEAKVVDGDQRMWLRAPSTETVTVLDYRGAPYVRFSSSGVSVNQRSAMFFLNQTPVPETPPANLGPRTPPRWQRVSAGHDYSWHDGRLHALASVALSTGASYVGEWRIPLLVDGRLSPITGGLWHAAGPSAVWFWPIVVLLLCVVAAWRVRSPQLDRWTARAVAFMGLAAVAVAALGRDLHGRPTVSVGQLIELSVLLAFVAWALVRIISNRAGYFTYFMVAFVAILEGAELVPTLLNGFVLMAVPAFVGRAACVLGLGAGVALLVLVPRLFDQRQEVEGQPAGQDDSALELA